MQLPPEVEPSHSSSLDIDDAFSDNDELETDIKLTTDAIRDDLAKNAESWRAEEDEQEISRDKPEGFFEVLDTSISTLHIDEDERSLSAPSSSHGTESPDGSSSAQFVSISLSNSGSDLKNEVFGEHVEDDTPLPNTTEAPYPNVLIDTSKSPTHRVTISTDFTETSAPLPAHSQGLDSAHSHTTSAASDSLSERSTKSLPAPELYPNTPELTPHPTASTSALPPSNTAVERPSASLPSNSKNSLSQSQDPSHRPSRSVGPSMFEKVRSRTRPSFLPPKSRMEDDKHMADWEHMMKHSRAAAEKRRKALQERRLAREKKVEDSLHLWEKEIVPDWKVVHKNPRLRKVWWRGIPSKLRASMWEHAVGNALALSKAIVTHIIDNYRFCLSRAKRALTSGAFPTPTLTTIDEDIASTLPSLHIFHHETGPLYSDLKDMLCAWVVARSDEGLGYTFGAAKIAAMFLINMPPPQAFVVMRNLLERHCLRSFFGGTGSKDDVEAYYRIFDTLLADGMPKIYFNFKQHQVSPASYLPDWLIPLFLDHLPFEACARVWDVIILEGDSFLYRAALGILAVLEPRLFFPERRELLELLRGENKAAIDVARREGRLLNGGKYEMYGVDEETLWERIDSMDEWWKLSTWNRLIQRELPDL